MSEVPYMEEWTPINNWEGYVSFLMVWGSQLMCNIFVLVLL